MKPCHLLYVIGSLGVLTACRNPVEDVQIRLKDPIQDGVVECRFYDPAGNPLPESNQVTIAGPNAAQVVTTLNTTRYKIGSEGNLLVAASPLATLSGQQPFRFTVVVAAPDYLTVVQPFELTNPNRQTRSVRRINLFNPPRTLTAARTTGRASPEGSISAGFGVTTAESDQAVDHATVQVEAGTKLTDRDGRPVGGDLTLTVIHTNARTDDATSQIPGGGILTNVKGRKDGSVLGSLRVSSIVGSMTVEMYNEKFALVRNLSTPLPWSMEVKPDAFNAKADRTVQVGDSIPLFSYDAVANRWEEEKPGVLVRNAQTGRLECRAEAAHPAAYVAGWTQSVCPVGPVFKVSSKLNGVDVGYLCKLIDANTGALVRVFYANVNNNALISITNQTPGRRFKLQVYDQTDAWGKGVKGGLVAESAPGASCSATAVPINLAQLPVPSVMSLEFAFSCPQGYTVDESAIPALLKTQHSQAGENNWHDLITATRTVRKVATYKLHIGRKYDLRASTDGGATWPLRENDFLVNKPVWTLKIEAPMYCK